MCYLLNRNVKISSTAINYSYLNDFALFHTKIFYFLTNFDIEIIDHVLSPCDFEFKNVLSLNGVA
jgi:hypothetical protein